MIFSGLLLLQTCVLAGEARASELTFGADFRERYEFFSNVNWGHEKRDGYLFHRVMAHGDVHLGDRFRVFLRLKSGLVSGMKPEPGPADQDKLDLHQGFVDGVLTAGEVHPGEAQSLLLRMGRQEYSYGSQRIVSIREVPNVRRSFDGVTLIWEQDGARVDAFASKPVNIRSGVFDDNWKDGSGFWGIYSTVSGVIPTVLDADLYYLGLRQSSARYQAGKGTELRHSAGIRVFSEKFPADFNFEGVYQWGASGEQAIRAWTLALDVGYTWRDVPLKPRLGLKADVATGDRAPGDGRLGTFNALFPKGTYFNYAAVLGPANLMDLHPSLTVQPMQGVSVMADWDFVWRHSRQDGIYDLAVNLITPGDAGQDKYVGSQLSLSGKYDPVPRWEFVGSFTHFFTGGFLKQATPGKDFDYLTFWVAYHL